MEWVNETLAIGSWFDLWNSKEQEREGIDACINARTAFHQVFLRFGRKPDPAKVTRAVELMTTLSDKGYRMMVHCYHGRDRSPFLAMAYLSRRLGIGYEEAFELVRKGRPRAIYHSDWVDLLRAAEEKNAHGPI